MQSCITSIAFHPVIPSILATGTFTGQVIVYDINADDPIIGSSKMDRLTHQEPVSKLCWMQEKSVYKLISVAGDGKIITWDLSNRLATPMAM